MMHSRENITITWNLKFFVDRSDLSVCRVYIFYSWLLTRIVLPSREISLYTYIVVFNKLFFGSRDFEFLIEHMRSSRSSFISSSLTILFQSNPKRIPRGIRAHDIWALWFSLGWEIARAPNSKQCVKAAPAGPTYYIHAIEAGSD